MNPSNASPDAHPLPRFHGNFTRGLTLAPKSRFYEGRFGRIFRSLAPADFGTDDETTFRVLTELGGEIVAGPDPVKDGSDDEESGIPALFTYFGQFVDHDLTFDPASSLQRQNDPDALVDFRTPAFDLDSVYGRGPDDQPYLYDEGDVFALGRSLSGKAGDKQIHGAHDLPRASHRHRAIIGDPRNDENVIVSQLQGLFHRFHNRLQKENPKHTFGEIQQLVRFHYQWIVIHDFLPRIVSGEVVNAVLPHLAVGTNVRINPPNLLYFHAKNDSFMPLEFAAAAYRFGHSMVRPGYRLNNEVIQPIFPFQGSNTPGPGLTGFDQFPQNWAIDWGRYIDLSPLPKDGEHRLQLAYRIDPSIVRPLGLLPGRVANDKPPLDSLAARNLIRGWRMRLPSGQSIAKAMGIEPLPDSEIRIGKALDPALNEPSKSIADIGEGAFVENCPLWVYVLAESAAEFRAKGTTKTVQTTDHGALQIGTPQLGAVGGRIVAETFAGLLDGDSNSYWSLDPAWKPSLAQNGKFGLRELVSYALGH